MEAFFHTLTFLLVVMPALSSIDPNYLWDGESNKDIVCLTYFGEG